jgi:cold shock CspA family protein
VHVNNLLESIKENNIVTFEVEHGARGLIAIKVKLFKEEKKEDPPK